MTIMQKPMKLSLKNCQKFLRYFIYGFIFLGEVGLVYAQCRIRKHERNCIFNRNEGIKKKKKIGIKTFQMIIIKIHSYSLAHT